MKLEFRDITKSFTGKQVLKGINLTAESGSAFGLLGRNGAGKTTSMRILMDVFRSDSGEILIDGSKIDYSKVSFGYLPEERGLYPKRKIGAQLTYFAELKGLSHKEAQKSVNEWLERLGMTDVINKNTETLSKGNQQKIQLITAVAHDPDIIILDEPFSGLDPVNATVLKDVIKSEISRGKLVLLSSHQMNYIEEFCDRIAIMKNGEIVLEGGLSDIKKSHSGDRIAVKGGNVEQIAREYNGEISGDRVIIKMKDPSDRKGLMLKIIEQYMPDDVGMFEPSLNDIFVQYTKDEEVVS